MISTITTAFLVPIAVILADKYQRRRGIDGKVEFHDEVQTTGVKTSIEENLG